MTPAHQDLARWLLRREREVHADPENDAPIAITERVVRKLSPRITVLVTKAGYLALLTRALHLARAEFPSLDSLQIGASGAYIEGPRVASRGDSDDSLVALIGTLIALLATFIGDDLTESLIRDAWPDAPLQRSAGGLGGPL